VERLARVLSAPRMRKTNDPANNHHDMVIHKAACWQPISQLQYVLQTGSSKMGQNAARTGLVCTHVSYRLHVFCFLLAPITAFQPYHTAL